MIDHNELNLDGESPGIPTSGHDYRTPGVLKIMSIGDEAMFTIDQATGAVTIHPSIVAYGGPDKGWLRVPGWNGSRSYHRGESRVTGRDWVICLDDIVCDAIADGRIPLFEEDDLAELERQWRHASQVAFASIGHPDRAANVAHRDELWAKLLAAQDPKTHPFKTNGFPVETCLTCGHEESEHG